MSTIMHDSTTTATTEGEHACSIIWDAETVRDMHEMTERATGHPCAGSVGGSCPVMPRALSTIAKQHADPRAVKVYAASAVVGRYADQVRAAERAAKSTTTPEEISRVFSDALKAAGISQRRAAAETGIPLSTLRRWLKDATPLLASELAVLADLLNTTVTGGKVATA
jgi:Helix-turn-helix